MTKKVKKHTVFEKIRDFLQKPKVERAIKTFIEVFSSYIALNIMTVDLTSETAINGLIAGAIGSAISMALNIKK